MPKTWTKHVHNSNISYSYKEMLVHKLCNLSRFLPTTFEMRINGENLSITMEKLDEKLSDPSSSNKLQAWLDILQAVAILNSFGIAHRDIKSDNIMYRDGKEAVLIDFDLSKGIGGNGGHTPDIVAEFYRPPELDPEDELQQYGFEIDSWSLGVWALELFEKDFNWRTFKEEWFNDEYEYHLDSLPSKIQPIVSSFLLTSENRKTALDWVTIENPKKLLQFPEDFDIDIPEKVKGWEYGYKAVAWGLQQEYPNHKNLTPVALWLTGLLFLPYRLNIHSLAQAYKMDADEINQLSLQWFIKWRVSK